jgi:parvulin-like peptidyl-prolyl isomerase
MRASRFLRRVLLPAVGGAAALACGQASGPIAEIAGRPISLEEFQPVLDQGARTGGAVSDEVKSRLLDQFLEERVLLEEARRRGVVVADADVDRALAGIDAPSEPGRREDARAALTVQRLLATILEETAPVTPEEEEAYYREHADAFQQPARLVVRQMLLEDEAAAAAAHAEVAADPSRFEEVAAARSASPDQGRSLEYRVDAIPSEITAILEGLGPGQISPVIEASGRYWIFRIEEVRVERSLDLEEARAEIRARLREQKGQGAMVELLAELKGRLGVKLHRENLPFRYVGAEPA